jgi:hypothetical protein
LIAKEIVLLITAKASIVHTVTHYTFYFYDGALWPVACGLWLRRGTRGKARNVMVKKRIKKRRSALVVAVPSLVL